MYLDLIKSVLKSRLSYQRKIDEITKIIDIIEEVEILAAGFSSAAGRKPISEDRLKAIRQYAKNKDIDLKGLDQKYLSQNLTDGINWLKGIISQDGKWVIKKNFKPFIVQDAPPTNRARPLKMCFVSPWEISMTVLVLLDWISFFGSNNDETIDLVKKGNALLAKIQSFFCDGSLGDTLWARKKNNENISSSKLEGNTLETCISIFSWIQSYLYLSKYNNQNEILIYKEFITRGIDYLKNNWNEDGGWGFKNGWESDIKSTAFSIMVMIVFITNSKNLSVQIGDESTEFIFKGLKWIINKQSPKDGSWEYSIEKNRDTAIFCEFYAIQALNMVMNNLYLMDKRIQELQKEINASLYKALTWYESAYKLIKDGDNRDWCWENHVKSSGVENTAAGLIVLLDSKWIDENSHLTEKTVSWLLKKKEQNHFWGVDTPLVLMCLMRIVDPKVRYYNKIRIQVTNGC
jgi:hypothetical protein